MYGLSCKIDFGCTLLDVHSLVVDCSNFAVLDNSRAGIDQLNNSFVEL